MIRLNTNGTIDATFVTGSGFPTTTDQSLNKRVSSIAIQSDGKYLIGGLLGSYNSTAVNNVVRLNSNGALDNTFIFSSVNFDLVTNLNLQTDGKIIVIGTKNSTINTIPIVLSSIERFSSTGLNDGTLNISNNFAGSYNSSPFIKSLQIQNDGKLIVLGTFTTYNSVTVNGIVRLTDQILSTNNFVIGQNIFYPNPVIDFINIPTTINTESTTFEIYNLLGQNLLKGNIDNSVINVASLPKGIYLLKMENGKNTINQKFIKE